MDIIKKWYADRLDKTPEEFDDVDNYIVIVLHHWEKERENHIIDLNKKP